MTSEREREREKHKKTTRSHWSRVASACRKCIYSVVLCRCDRVGCGVVSVRPYPTPSNHILPCLTFVYTLLRCLLLPSYTGFYPVLPFPTMYSTAILPHIQPSPTLAYPLPTSSYTRVSSHPTLSYIILPPTSTWDGSRIQRRMGWLDGVG